MLNDNFLRALDWDGVIAECTVAIAAAGVPLVAVPVAAAPAAGVPAPAAAAPAVPHCLAYLRRGFARLFVRNKDDKYADAIADFSNAINVVPNHDCWAAQYYRACAYYLNGDYERARFSWDALAAAGHSTPQPGFVPSTHEALGKTYMAMSRYSEAVHELEEALRNDYFANNILPDFNLIHLYREACQRMNNA